MSEQKNTLLGNLVGGIIVVPIILVLFVISFPFILYLLIIKVPILAFLKRNIGKKILCISPGRKFQVFYSNYHKEILSLGIDDIVVFDATKPDNQYDGFKWDAMVSRSAGFPLLVSINDKVITQQSLKCEFMSYFKKEIDWIQLRGCIKRKVDGKSY
jgi:hypothetical protein